MPASLREITMDNFRACLTLTVAEDRKGFVASNMYSLAEAKADAVSNPLAIHAGDDMVGFIMYDYASDESRGYITRLMVDALPGPWLRAGGDGRSDRTPKGRARRAAQPLA